MRMENNEMTAFPKTIAAVQRRDRCMWEIGEALLAECGPPSTNGKHDGSYAKLEAASQEIEHLKIEGYTVDYLAKIREVAHKFPSRIRNPGVSWAAHRSSGSPAMLGAILKAAGSKPVTNAVVRSTRAAIEDRQAREYRKENPGKPLPPRREMPVPSTKEVKGVALIAEIARWVSTLKSADQAILSVTEMVDEKLPRLEAVDIDYLVDIALGLSQHARELADIARKLRSNRKANLSVVGERDS
jgi:hypothetical protein